MPSQDFLKIISGVTPEELATILTNNPDLANEEDEHGLTLLDHAAADNRLDIVQFLITKTTKHPHSLLIQAAKFGHLELLQWAVDYWSLSCDPHKEPDPLIETLVAAAENGHKSIVEWLINVKAVDWQQFDIWRVLETVIRADKQEILRYLFPLLSIDEKQRIIPNLCRLAAEKGQLASLNFIISHSDTKTDCYKSAIDTAANHGHVHIIQNLAGFGANFMRHALYNAALAGHSNIIRWMVNNNHIEGWELALNELVKRKQHGIVTFLIDHKNILAVAKNYNWTPILHSAMETFDVDLFRRIISDYDHYGVMSGAIILSHKDFSRLEPFLPYCKINDTNCAFILYEYARLGNFYGLKLIVEHFPCSTQIITMCLTTANGIIRDYLICEMLRRDLDATLHVSAELVTSIQSEIPKQATSYALSLELLIQIFEQNIAGLVQAYCCDENIVVYLSPKQLANIHYLFNPILTHLPEASVKEITAARVKRLGELDPLRVKLKTEGVIPDAVDFIAEHAEKPGEQVAVILKLGLYSKHLGRQNQEMVSEAVTIKIGV